MKPRMAKMTVDAKNDVNVFTVHTTKVSLLEEKKDFVRKKFQKMSGS